MESDDKFRFINSINTMKNDLTGDADLEKDYNPFFINRSLSYHHDTLFHALQMDRYSSVLSKKDQYHYLLVKVKKAKRFAKVARKTGQSVDDDLQLVQEYFSFNIQKARAALSILTKKDLDTIKQKTKKGGIQKRDEQRQHN